MEDLNEKLMEAIRQENKREVKRLLKAGADINHIDHRGMTPLICAVTNDGLDMAELLLKHGADPNPCPAKVAYPLPLQDAIDGAVQASNYNEYIRGDATDMIKLLLKYGADRFARDHQYGKNAVELARNYHDGAYDLFLNLDNGTQTIEKLRLGRTKMRWLIALRLVLYFIFLFAYNSVLSTGFIPFILYPFIAGAMAMWLLTTRGVLIRDYRRSILLAVITGTTGLLTYLLILLPIYSFRLWEIGYGAYWWDWLFEPSYNEAIVQPTLLLGNLAYFTGVAIWFAVLWYNEKLRNYFHFFYLADRS